MSNYNTRTLRERFSEFPAAFAAYFMRYGHLLLPLTAGILSFVSTWILFDAVLNRSGDDMYHLLNEYVLADGARAGDNIFGPLGMEYGQPVLRFYQSMFYLFNVSLHLITGVHLTMMHNITICLCFGLSPFTLYYFFRKLGINRWTAGFGSFLSMISVAAFGNSYEAYFQAGIVTQSAGGLLFPLFMGSFVGMLRGENSPVTTGALFGLTFLSHVIMAVYATFACVLYVFISDTSWRQNIRRFLIFGITGVALVAFWLMPFMHHNSTMRPEPDAVFRGSGVHWYTSLSTAELITVASKGYMLDDARAKGNDRNDAEKLMDRINIIGTLSIRPPVVTALTALGIFFALFRLRRLSVRFLLGGFAFSLMLYAGPDDFRWLRFLPFMDKIQAFRCIYLVEIFAFGLCAIGIESIVGVLYTFFRKRQHWWSRVPLMSLWVVGVGAGLGWIGTESVKIGQVHLVVQEENSLNQDLDALRKVPNRGYPWRVEVRCEGRPKIRQAWFAMHGFQPYCTHWKGTGPEPGYDLCGALGNPDRNLDLFGLAGVRWFTGWGPKGQAMKDAKDEDQLPALKATHPGNDRRGKSNGSRVLLDGDLESFLRPMAGAPLPVVCNDKQWLWLAKSWTLKFKNNLRNPRMPVILRVKAGGLQDSGLLRSSAAVLYLDHDAVNDDAGALAEFSKNGGVVITPLEIAGVKAEVLPTDGDPWEALPKDINTPMPATSGKIERDEENPAFETAKISMVRPAKRTYQQFVFDVEMQKSAVAILPMERYPGWKAFLDGKEIPVFSAGPDMVGVHLPQGVHRVRFAWEMPGRDRAAMIISFLAALFILGVWIRRRILCALNERYVPAL